MEKSDEGKLRYKSGNNSTYLSSDSERIKDALSLHVDNATLNTINTHVRVGTIGLQGTELGEGSADRNGW